jgi:hypothetical protein
MRRLMPLALLCSLALVSICSAATLTGKQADYKSTTTIDMQAMAAAITGATGKPMPKGQNMPASKPIVTTGKLIWTAGKSRTDMKNAYSGSTDTTLVDFAAKKLYMLDRAAKTATSIDMTDQPLLSGLMRAGQGGQTNTQQDYAATLKQMQSMQGVTVKQVGAKKVNGYDCHGMELTIDLSKFKDSIMPPSAGKVGAQSQQVMSSAFAAMGTMTSDLWISDKYNVLVKSLSKTKGMSIVVELSNISDWSGPDSTFAVPAGYKVQDSAAMMQNWQQKHAGASAHH